MPTAVPVVPVLRNPCSSFMVLRISLRAVKSPPAMAMHIRAVAYLPRWRGPSHAGIPLDALALVLFGGGFRGGDFTDIGFVRIDDVHRPDDRGLIELLQFARGDQHAGFQR